MRNFLASLLGIAAAVVVGWLLGRAMGLHYPFVMAIFSAAAGAVSAAGLGLVVHKRGQTSPRAKPIPLNGVEVAILCGIVFCYGIAIGLFAGALPHPTVVQRSVSSIFMLAGMVTFVGFAIFRINKEWKIRTTQPQQTEGR